jgi:L-iditol 2-dehydrogenase
VLAALLYGKEDLRLETVADPTPEPGEIIMQVLAATTCGTDLKVWRRGGHAKMLQLPTLFGHEAAGQIVAIGSGVRDWRIGDRVVANNSAPCFGCFFCQRQEYSLCTNLIFNNGTFAQYLKIPAAIVQHNLLSIPPDLPDAVAALTEPLACVLHGVARSNVKPGDRVVVLGDGAIGLMFVGALTQQLTEGWGADIVIEATGVPSVWEQAIACARPGATVNLFGGCPRDTAISVNTEQLHYSELTLKGVFHNTPQFVRSALNLLASRVLPFEQLVSDRQPLTQLEQVFQDMKARRAIKVAIEP